MRKNSKSGAIHPLLMEAAIPASKKVSVLHYTIVMLPVSEYKHKKSTAGGTTDRESAFKNMATEFKSVAVTVTLTGG